MHLLANKAGEESAQVSQEEEIKPEKTPTKKNLHSGFSKG